MEKVLKGGNRRYHIERLVAQTGEGSVYRAFSRRKAGDGWRRRYYAIVELEGSGDEVCDALEASSDAIPYSVHIDEIFKCDGRRYAVVARGRRDSRFRAIANKGYLMMVLAALILILMIIRAF